ncbi:transposable element Tc1 transposase [Trichonephila clavipes]|nr:transposable element Tc1 transposase [Trichonephila clavipes]
MNHTSIWVTMMAAFVLDDMPLNAALSVIERHSGLTLGIMVWCVISYHGRSNVLRIEGNLNSNSPTHATSSLASYSPDMSPIEHVGVLVGRRLARNPRPAASKGELLMRIEAIWNSLPQADIQNLIDSMPRRIATLIAARGGYTKF